MFVPIRDENRLRSIPYQYVTLGLIAVNFAVFIGLQLPDLLQGDVCGQMLFAKLFGVVPIELTGTQTTLDGCTLAGALSIPEPLTLISYQFLHGDVLHLLGNMLFLWVFGDNVEDALGHVRYLVFYLACGIAGALLHVVMTAEPSAPLIGASAAIAGVVGAYLVLHPNVNVWVLVMRFFPLKLRAVWVLGAWVLMNLAFAVLSIDPLVAWWAHVGGIIAGIVLVVILRRPGVPLFDRGTTA
ncbi:MAG: rhomboid family intramembrane serine protease [Hyphomicrobiaceae bacterium]